MKTLSLLILGTLAFGQNKLHPTFPFSLGPETQNGDVSKIEKACGSCHALESIRDHNPHARSNLNISCLDCHLPVEMKETHPPLDDRGWVLQSWVEHLQRPSSRNCIQCHDQPITSSSNSEPEKKVVDGLAIADLVDSNPAIKWWPHHLMQTQGSFFSPQKVSDSFLNLETKQDGDAIWDVHAQRQLNCVSCHTTDNNPAQNHMNAASLNHLKFDVREELPISIYLRSPNHQLRETNCTSCHDPLASHKGFPYRERHLANVSCQACHIPEVIGPLLRRIDRSIYLPTGTPLLQYWNTPFEIPPKDEQLSSINTELIHRQKPFLMVKEGKVWPYNIVMTRQWVLQPAHESDQGHKGAGTILSADQFKEFFWNDPKNQKELFRRLDRNQNGQIEVEEWQGASQDRDDFILAVLRQKGFAQAQLKDDKIFFKVGHGVQPARQALKDCRSCHGSASRFDQQTATYGLGLLLSDKPHDPTLPKIDKYVLGTTRNSKVDLFGLWALALLVLSVVAHAGLRVWFARKNKLVVSTAPVQTIYIYGLYERFWHWTLAFSTIGLLVTGLEVHYPESFSLFGYRNAILLHNGSAFLFILNAGLSLFYHLTNAKLQQFIPPKDHLVLRLKEQLTFYLHGIFSGPQSHLKSPTSKLNPLQQITYLALLNLLLPLQMVTGVLMWAVDKSNTLSALIGGYAVLGPLHTLGSWFFLLFLLLHLYLTTTGETPLAHIKSMLTGEEHTHRGDQ